MKATFASEHTVDRFTFLIPNLVSWDCVDSVVSLLQEHSNKRKCGVVCMLLEYVVRTLEDDFHAKRAFSVLQHSISRATLSCDRQFHHVR